MNQQKNQDEKTKEQKKKRKEKKKKRDESRCFMGLHDWKIFFLACPPCLSLNSPGFLNYINKILLGQFPSKK